MTQSPPFHDLTIPAQRAGDRPNPPSAVTRHLSAGAYVDEDFRRLALSEVHDQTRRMIAPSYGFDLPTVLAHCRRARSATLARDGALIGLMLLIVCVFPFTVLLVGSVLITQQLAMATWRLVRDALAQLRVGGGSLDFDRLRTRMWLLLFGYVFGALIASIAVSAIFAALISIAGSEMLGGSSSQALPAGSLIGAVLLGLAMYGVSVGFNLWRQARLDLLAPGRRPEAVALTPRLSEIRALNQGNVVAYSGYEPFVGSGVKVSQWGTALRLIHRDPNLANPTPEALREFTQAPFSAKQIKDYVAGRMRQLGGTSEPEQAIFGLTVEDLVFLSGSEVTKLSPFMTPEQVDQVIRYPVTPIRHFLACRVESWRGELVTNVYVHFAVQGQTLYLELSSWVLPPCANRFRIVDMQGGTGQQAQLRALWRGVVDMPRTVGRAPVNLLRTLSEVITSRNATANDAPIEAGLDYGARTSVRELASSPALRNSFLSHDFDKYSRIIERRVIALVHDFLEANNVDMAEFRQRAVNILNNGVMHTGNGNIDNSGAVGHHANVTNSGGGRD